MVADPEVRAVIAAIGGDHSCHLLPLLDWDLIRSNPTILMGFSDVTVLNVAIHAMTGLVTFNGPAVMTDFGEYPSPLPCTIDMMLRVLASPRPAGTIAPAESWTEEFLDWETQADLARPREFEPSAGWTWLKGGWAQGRLIGGCLESLQHLRGTPYWPDFEGAIFFWETSEEVPPPATVDGMLQDYENMGVLKGLAGMLVGRSYRYTAEQKEELRQVVLQRTARYDFPIVMDMDFGHTSPQMTLPLGIRAELAVEERHFALVEGAVRGASC